MKRKRHLWNVVWVENKQWETVDTEGWAMLNQSLAIQKTYKRMVVIVANECKYNIYLYNINLFIYKYL